MLRKTWVQSLLTGALVGAIITAPLMALLYLGEQVAGLPLVPFDFFDWLARVLPGDVIRAGISATVDLIDRLDLGETSGTAKSLETLQAIAMFFAGGGVLAALYFLVRPRFSIPKDGWRRVLPRLALGVVFGLPMILISRDVTPADTSPWVNLVWLAALFLAWGYLVEWSYEGLMVMRPSEEAAATVDAEEAPVLASRLSRREFLIQVGGTSATLTVIGAGVARWLEWQDERDYEKLIERRRAAAQPGDLPNANDPLMPAPGTRPEYTPLEDHYRIDINLRPQEIDPDEWRLKITGLVDNPREFTLDELKTNYEPLNQYVTLACISNTVGGDLTSTTRWTGARLQEVLDDVGVQEGARYLSITSADGFHESVDLELIAAEPRVMLTYYWDGIPLLHSHGHPLRIYIPDRYGMKQPKWITDIEVTDTYHEGYWVERDWDEVAQMRATAVVDVVASDMLIEQGGQQLVPIGGIAHAGARGISKVEVKVDDGDWVEAQLRQPLSETTWVIWRYDWPYDPGRHTFTVRCEEGDGTPQITEEANRFPSGATGLHSRTRSV
jgi:DMSO/TMAO reductase YedYZ molybdopterin-dependent catalytic subunit